MPTVHLPDIQLKGLLMGLADFAFPIGLPILALILGVIREAARHAE